MARNPKNLQNSLRYIPLCMVQTQQIHHCQLVQTWSSWSMSSSIGFRLILRIIGQKSITQFQNHSRKAVHCSTCWLHAVFAVKLDHCLCSHHDKVPPCIICISLQTMSALLTFVIHSEPLLSSSGHVPRNTKSSHPVLPCPHGTSNMPALV